MRVLLTVVEGRGLPMKLELDAPSIEAARQQALARGLAVLAARPASPSLLSLGLLWVSGWFGRPAQSIQANQSTPAARRLDITVLIEQLRDLLAAGLSVIESLGALSRGARGQTVATVEQLQRQLQEGKTLSDALACDAAFPGLLVALVKASELTSDLPQALGRFLEHEKRVAEVRHRVVSTSIYPLLLTGVGSLVIVFLLFYVMPRFARIFDGMPGPLPWSAQAMVAWAHLLQAWGPAWMLGGAVLLAAGLGLLASPAARAAALRRLLAWGPLRTRLHTYFLARWYRATGLLVQGGIPLVQALQLANSLLPAALQAQGRAVEQGVRQGLSPSAAHARVGMATPVAEQLMLAGERTGDLGAVLSRVAQFHEAEVSRDLERTMRALEPIVMVMIGLGVGAVVVLMYMPIFELAAAIQ